MKKSGIITIIMLLIVLMTLTIFNSNVVAATSITAVAEQVVEKQEVEIKVSFGEKVSIAQFKLSYDTTKFDYVSNSVGEKNFSSAVKQFGYTSIDGKTPDLESVSFKFRAKKAGSGNFTISNVKISTATQDKLIPNISQGAVTVTIKQEIPITSVTLNKTSMQLEVGGESSLSATVKPTNTTQSKTVTWTSSNTNVAVVDKNGKVTAKSAGTATITAKTSNGKTATCIVTVKTKKTPSVSYRTHVENIGWQSYVKNGTQAGTSGKSLRLEAIQIKLENNEDYSGGITYQTHIQNIGWQNYKKDDAVSGTSGMSYRLEAIRIKLTGDIANYYDVYYRVHSEDFGWLDWAKNDEPAGTEGYSYRLEAIEIRLIKKGAAAPGNVAKPYVKNYLIYQTHVENDGWQDYVNDRSMSGTSGRSLRLEGIRIRLQNQPYSGNIEYRTHIENIGWQKSYVKNGEMSGTSGRSLRLEAIQIRLTGEMAKHYDIYYRVHAQNFGWLGWAKNGQQSGTAGYSYRLEGIEICLIEKGGSAPGSTSNCFRQK